VRHKTARAHHAPRRRGDSVLAARAQQISKVPKIGVLWHADNAEQEAPYLIPFEQSLSNLGYVDGRNVKLLNTYAAEQYERFHSNAGELAKIPVDVMVAVTRPAAFAAQKSHNDHSYRLYSRSGSRPQQTCQQPVAAWWKPHGSDAARVRAERQATRALQGSNRALERRTPGQFERPTSGQSQYRRISSCRHPTKHRSARNRSEKARRH
jgi:hypothetical protein